MSDLSLEGAQAQDINSVNITASAQLVMEQQQSATLPYPFLTTMDAMDVTMADSKTPDRAASPVIPVSANNAPPSRTNTPMRTNGDAASSRAASLHPDTSSMMPKEAKPNGAPVRQYLNHKVTQVLMDGMKKIAREQPNDPLRVLGEYLLEKSRKLERTEE